MSDFRTDGLSDTSGIESAEERSRRQRAADAARSAASDMTAKAKAEAATLRTQAGDKARSFAVDGKARASGALDGLADMLEDAAVEVDAKLGQQFGGYARQAASSVHGFANTLRDRDVDDLVNDARQFVRSSPALAIGAAAAIGFVLARLVKSGLDEAGTLGTDSKRSDLDRDVAFAPDRDTFGGPGDDSFGRPGGGAL